MSSLFFSSAAASIRRRLIASLVSLTVLLSMVVAYISYDKSRHEVEEVLDGQLALSARLVSAYLTDQSNQDLVLHLGKPSKAYEQPIMIQVWNQAGRLVAHSDNAPLNPIAAQEGYSNMVIEDEEWRIFSVRVSNGRFNIQIAEPLNSRDQASLEVLIQVWKPIVLLVPVAVFLFIYAINDALKPLSRLAGKVSSRSVANLESVNLANAPQEVQPLVLALNALLSQLKDAMDLERRFTADAAHELRTPLAAIQVQAQLALIAPEGEPRNKALHGVVQGTRRASRLVEQLLRLARLDPLRAPKQWSSVHLSALIQDLIQEYPLDADRIRVQIDDQLLIQGDADLIFIALRNILDNALRYSDEESEIRVGYSTREDGIEIWVEDQGVGVPEEELARLAERFFRASSASREGCGLGLAIVARVVALHEAKLSFANRPEGGLHVGITFYTPKALC